MPHVPDTASATQTSDKGGQVACPPVSEKSQDETSTHGENVMTAEHTSLPKKVEATAAATVSCSVELGPEWVSSEIEHESLKANERPAS